MLWNGFIFSTRPYATVNRYPGYQLGTIKKIEVAKKVELLGVDMIEAEFPVK